MFAVLRLLSRFFVALARQKDIVFSQFGYGNFRFYCACGGCSDMWLVHGGGEDLVGRRLISRYSRGEGEGRHVWFGGMKKFGWEYGNLGLEGMMILVYEREVWKVGWVLGLDFMGTQS